MPDNNIGRRRPKKLKGSEAQEAGIYTGFWIIIRLIPTLIVLLLILKALQLLGLL